MGHAFALNEIYEVRPICYTNDQVGLSVLHYQVIAIGVGTVEDGDFADQLSTILGPLYGQLISEQAEYLGVEVQKVWPLPRLDAQSSDLNNTPGVIAGDTLPTQSCGLIRKRTGFAGKHNRGRMYVPFPSENDNDVDGQPTAPYLVSLANLAAALEVSFVVTVGIDSVTLEPVIYDRVAHTTTGITHMPRQDQWATQRRRGDQGRPNPRPTL
jgi:hypothetical protein